MPSDQVCTVLGAVAAAVDTVLGLATWQLASHDVGALVEGLAREEPRLAAARLRVVAEGAEQRVGAASGFVSVPGWYAATTRSRVRSAGRTVGLATALVGPLAPTGAALASGSISEAHAEVVHRVMTRVGEVLDADARAGGAAREAASDVVERAQAFLVDHATRLDPDQLAVAGKHLVARLRSPEADDAAARADDAALAALGVTLAQTPDGSWFLRGVLDAVGGAKLAAALDAGSAPRPARPDGTRDLRTPAQRRGEALVGLADAHLGAVQSRATSSRQRSQERQQSGGERSDDATSATEESRGGQPCGHGTTGARARLTVAVDATTLVDPWARGAAPGELTVPGCGDRLGGHPLSPAALAALACDAEVVPVLLGVDGVPLDVGRTVYAWPERIRRAIAARDRGCTLPHACGTPADWCQIHHLTSYSRGGSTSERNGALVCMPGHRTTHRLGWSGRLVGDQVVWTTPDRLGGPGGELRAPPPWKPALDRLVGRWQRQLTTAPPRAVHPQAGGGGGGGGLSAEDDPSAGAGHPPTPEDTG